MPTVIWHLRLGSGSAHCDLDIWQVGNNCSQGHHQIANKFPIMGKYQASNKHLLKLCHRRLLEACFANSASCFFRCL